MERLRLVWGSGCFLGVAIDEDGSIAIQPSEWFDNGWHVDGWNAIVIRRRL